MLLFLAIDLKQKDKFMASINYAAREISVKIVYYGPGLSGKTTNLQVIHRKVPQEYKSDMVSLATETDRTLFFDFLPLDLGKIKGFSTKFQLYTVPGQVYYNATRKLVLRGVDGVVFVADSAPDKIQENLESFQNLEENLAEYGYKRDNVPIIIQYNKRDLPNALTTDELQRMVNKYNLPWSEAVANKGVGVFDSLKLIGKIVIDYLNKKYSRQPRTESSMPASEPKRMPSADQYNQQPAQFPSGTPNQFSGYNNQYQAPMGSAPTFQQPQQQHFQQQFRAVPPQQMQPRPVMPPRPQQPHVVPPQQRVVPPQQPMAQNPKVMPNQQYMANPGIHPQSQQYIPPSQPVRPPQQTFRGPQVQPGMNNSLNNQFLPPQPKIPVPPQQPHFQMPAQDTFEQASFEEQTFEPPVADQGQQGGYTADVQQGDYYNYGSINLEPMQNHQQTYSEEPEEMLEQNQNNQADYNFTESDEAVDFSQNQSQGSGKTDLDLEIEKYQREIEEKQKKMRGQPAMGQPSQPSVQKNPQTQYPPQNPAPQVQRPYPGQTQENDYDVYNMEMPSYPQNMPPTQKQPAIEEGDDAMFFTSVDTDRQKRPVKKPVVNPRTQPQDQQQKGFLSKFFNRETP